MILKNKTFAKYIRFMGCCSWRRAFDLFDWIRLRRKAENCNCQILHRPTRKVKLNLASIADVYQQLNLLISYIKRNSSTGMHCVHYESRYLWNMSNESYNICRYKIEENRDPAFETGPSANKSSKQINHFGTQKTETKLWICSKIVE